MKNAIRFLYIVAVLMVSACHQMSPAQQAALQRDAARPVVCQRGADCQEKWGRAVQWITRNSEFKVQVISDNLIQTYGPSDEAFWAYTITKVDQGKNTLIDFTPACGNIFGCVISETEIRASFTNFVMGPR